MIGSAADLAKAIEAAHATNPDGRHVFEIVEGLGALRLRNLRFRDGGGIEIVGGSIASLVARGTGPLHLRDVTLTGDNGREDWGAGAGLHQLRFGGDADLTVERCRFGADAEPWRLPMGALIERARAVRFADCRFDGCFNGVAFATTPEVSVHACDFRRIIGDAMAVRNVDPNGVSSMRLSVLDTLVCDFHPIERTHSDCLQITSDVPVWLDLRRNVFWTPGRSAQGIFIQTRARGVIAQNALLIRNANAISVAKPEDLGVYWNVVATELSGDPAKVGRGARILAGAPGMTTRGNLVPVIVGAKGEGDRVLPRGRYIGQLRGPWARGKYGDVFMAPPPLDAPAAAIKSALRAALSPA